MTALLWGMFVSAASAQQVYTVSTEAQLRSAMASLGNGDTVQFANGVGTLALTGASGPLPIVAADNVTIDGGGDVALDGTAITGDGLHVTGAFVRIEGLELFGFSGAGIHLDGARDAVVGQVGQGNVVRGNGAEGILVADSARVTLKGNRIGLDSADNPDGNCTIAAGCAGLVVDIDSATAAIHDNVVASNHGAGVHLRGDDALFEGNLVGVGAAGTNARPNDGTGVLVFGGFVGLPPILDRTTGATLRGNVVAANTGHGIYLGRTSAATVTGNAIGLTVAGGPMGNGGDGLVADATSSGHTLASNDIGANAGSGISLGGSGHAVDGNYLGTTTTTRLAGNAAYGLRVTGHAAPDDAVAAHVIGVTLPNVVGDNDLGGIWVDAANTQVENNLVGLDTTGMVATPNGLGSGSSAFGGVLVTAPVPSGHHAPAVVGNTIAANAGHGLWVRGGQHADGTDGVYVYDNRVGLDVAGGAMADGGDALRVEGASGALIDANEVGAAAAHGIHLLSSPTRPVLDAFVTNNQVGDPLGSYGAMGNGILLERSSGDMAVADSEVTDNVVGGSGERGIELRGGPNYVLVSHNLISSNGACAYRNDEESNQGSNGWRAPEILGFTASSVDGHVDMSPGTVARIEVYEGADLEAGTHLGDVTTVAADGTWSLTGVVVAATDISQLRALAVKADGVAGAGRTTSDLTHVPDDGCEPLDCLGLNTDDDWCTFWALGETGCVEVQRPDGYTCSDRDPRNDGATFGDLSTRDECLLGVCTPAFSTDLTPDDCPFATACNTAYFDDRAGWLDSVGCDPTDPADTCYDPDKVFQEICKYRSKCGDTLCGVDDLNVDGNCNACGGQDCDLVTDGQDGDFDGHPDLMEASFDWNCDGAVDPEVDGLLDASAAQSFLVLAYMSTDCSDPSEAYQHTTAGVHSHRPRDSDLDDMKAAFLNSSFGAELIIDLECVPHFTQVSMAHHRPNLDPDCDHPDDFVYFRQLKHYAFEPWQRGIYRFGLVAHGPVETDLTPGQQLDGECTSTSSKSGDAEVNGDDFRVYKQKGVHMEPDDPTFVVADPGRLGERNGVFHELGHTLGLAHGGGQDRNHKPNYQSRMNYRYQSALYEETGDTSDTGGKGMVDLLDFSEEAEAAIYEGNLDEGASYVSAMPVGERRWMTWACDTPNQADRYPFLPDGHASFVDWDCDGAVDPPGDSLDLNGDGERTNLTGHNDWQAVLSSPAAFCSTNEYLADAPDPPDRPVNGLVRLRVDVAPECSPNSVSLDDSIPLRAVLYGSAAVDVSSVDRSTLRLGGGWARKVQLTDRDGDGFDDLALWFAPSTMSLLHAGSDYALFNAHSTAGALWWAKPAVVPGSYGDTDGDRVIDPCDQCAHTPAGAVVDAVGCP